MQHLKTALIGCAGLLLLALCLTNGPAVAQAVQATLFRNADEPGHNPYQSSVIFNALTGGLLTNPCSADQCLVAFARVPEGKRLVLRNITGFVRASSASYLQFLSLAHAPGNNPPLTVLPIRQQQSSPQIYSFNEAIDGYVEAGQAPVFSAFGSRAFLNPGQYSQVKLSGYLVDLRE